MGLSLPGPVLPSVRRLRDLMLELGCAISAGVCSTHNQSLLVHDGGRVACRAAWEAAALPPPPDPLVLDQRGRVVGSVLPDAGRAVPRPMSGGRFL